MPRVQYRSLKNDCCLLAHWTLAVSMAATVTIRMSERRMVAFSQGCAVQRHHVLALPVVAMCGQHETILQPMRYQQRAGFINVALLHDQFDDGG